MERAVIIDGKEVRMRASALVPRLYRFKFNRDIIGDMNILRKSYNKALSEDEQLSVLDLTIFENVAYIMARHADPTIPDTVDEWLEQFNMFSIYEVLPVILELWNGNMETTSTARKK